MKPVPTNYRDEIAAILKESGSHPFREGMRLLLDKETPRSIKAELVRILMPFVARKKGVEPEGQPALPPGGNVFVNRLEIFRSLAEADKDPQFRAEVLRALSAPEETRDDERDA